MMDISVLDETEIDNSCAIDCGDDYSTENVLESDNKDSVDAEMKELPDQLMDSEVGHFLFSATLFYKLSDLYPKI